MTMTETYNTPVRATLAGESFNEDADVWRFHGTVIENNEKTNGKAGPKVWPPEALEDAAGQLTDKPVVNGHNYDDDGDPLNEYTEGVVLEDWYDPTVGWRYEMELGNAELARKLHNGHLEVSFHGGGYKSGETPDGRAIMAGVAGKDLAVVPYGGARENTANPGPAPDKPTSAVAMAANVEEPPIDVGGNDGGEEGEEGGDNDNDNGGADSDNDNSDVNMNDNDNDNGGDALEGIELEGRVVIDEERHSELTNAEAELESAREERDKLEAELSNKDEQINKVKGIYAGKLAELSGFSEEFFEDKDLEELETELAAQLDVEDDEDAAEVALSNGPATPQTGDDGGSVDVSLSGMDSDTREEIVSLSSRAKTFDSFDPEHADTLREQAVELAGVEDFETLEEAEVI